MPITLASNRTFFLWSDIQALDLVLAAKGYCVPVDEFSIKQNISLMRSKVHGELRPFGLGDVLTMRRMTTMALKTEKMDASNSIAYNLVKRLDDFSIRGSSCPTWYTTRKFGSFCPRLTCETRLLSQGGDFFTPTSYPWDASPALVDASWQTTSFGTVRDCNKSVTPQGWHLIRMNRRGWYRGEGARETVGLYRQSPLRCLA